MKLFLNRWGLLLLGLGLLIGTLLPGCGGSGDNPDSQLNGNFSGLYVNAVVVTNGALFTTNGAVMTTNNSVLVTTGGAIVSTNSGKPVMSLDLTQSKSYLRAVDNNGDVFTGTFSIVYAYGGMIQMNGQTTTGTPVQIAGYIETSGSSAWINATWIEPNLTSPLNGTAQVTPFSPTNPAVWVP